MPRSGSPGRRRHPPLPRHEAEDRHFRVRGRGVRLRLLAGAGLRRAARVPSHRWTLFARGVSGSLLHPRTPQGRMPGGRPSAIRSWTDCSSSCVMPNPDLDAAVARYQQARSVARRTWSNVFPTVDADASFNGSTPRPMRRARTVIGSSGTISRRRRLVVGNRSLRTSA